MEAPPLGMPGASCVEPASFSGIAPDHPGLLEKVLLFKINFISISALGVFTFNHIGHSHTLLLTKKGDKLV